MHFIVVIIGIALLLGLLFRSKGDSLLDTLQSGCGILFVIIVLIVLFFIFF
jgi:hypothetical protein